MKYFLHLAYDGSRYKGWQSQKNVPTIQSEIRKAVSTLLRKDTSIMGCGRTDTGVHALQYFAHLNSECPLDSDFLHKLNRFLDNDIVVYDIIPQDRKAHVQKDAISRKYDYLFSFTKQVYLNEFVTVYDKVDFEPELIDQAMLSLQGEIDFKSFCPNPEDYKHTRCKIFNASFSYHAAQDIYQLSFQADRFLKSMVRILVARLVEIAMKRLTIDEFKSALKAQTPLKYMKPAYCQGLFMSEVCYPYLNLIPRKSPLDLAIFH